MQKAVRKRSLCTQPWARSSQSSAGGDIGAGALAGAASEIANGVLQGVLKANPNLIAEQKSVITRWVATIVGAAIGGQTGAAAALDNVNFNHLTHKERDEFNHALADCDNGDKAACGHADELRTLSETRDQRLDFCVGNSSAACVKARIDLRIAAAEYIDAALTGDGENLYSLSLLARHMLFIEAWPYADSNDAENGQDFGDALSRLNTDAAKALLTAQRTKSPRSFAIRSSWASSRSVVPAMRRVLSAKG